MVRSRLFAERLLDRTPNCSITEWNSLFQFAIAFACAAGVFLYSCNAADQGRDGKNNRNSNRSRQAASAAKARREKMINSLEQQVAHAKKVLEKTQSKSQMTNAELTSAAVKLSDIREEIENTQHDAVEAARTLHNLEAELIAEQGPESEFVKAQATIDELKKNLLQTICRVLDLSIRESTSGKDSVKEVQEGLTSTQLSALHDNQDYRDAEKSLKDAIQNAERIRHKLFHGDSEWVAAHETLVNANHDKLEGEKERRATGTAAAEKRHELENVQNLAETARSIIARGEHRLRQLGAGVPQKKPTAKSGSTIPRKK